MSSPFGELISAGEGDYNSYNRGTTKDKDGRDQIVPANQVIDFSQMTIGELRRRQGLPLSHPDRVFAVGKYQFIPDTLNEGLGYLRIERDKKFTPELQDQLFVEYSLPKKRPEISAYIQGTPGATLQAAQKATSKEWASVEDPDTPGHVYWKYEKSGNKMHTTAAQVAIALNEMRAEYRAQIDKGLSAEEAWCATASMGPGSFEHGANVHKVSRRFEPDATTRQLQETLNALGCTDAHGHVLAADGHNGSHTRELKTKSNRQARMKR
jgi:muramidase (phage lysozyme)